MKILVTGAGGFIGFHLSKALIERGDEVIGLDCLNDYYDVKLKFARLAEFGIDKSEVAYGKTVASQTGLAFSFLKMDLADKQGIEACFAAHQFDAAVNLAAQAGVRYSIINPNAYVQSNIVGFANVIEAARQHSIKHLVYASSSSVYGLNEKMPFSTSDNVDHPISLYAASKKGNELIAHSYSHLFKLPTTGLRFFTVYGPWGRPDMALFLFTKAILADEPIQVFNHGNMMRDFTYIDDIVEGIVRVIDNPPAGKADWSGKTPDPSCSVSPYKIYNIGNNNPVKLMDYIGAVEKALGKMAIKELLPLQPGDVPASHADVSDLVEDLGYKPNTSVVDGVSRFIDWYKAYYNVSL